MYGLYHFQPPHSHFPDTGQSLDYLSMWTCRTKENWQLSIKLLGVFEKSCCYYSMSITEAFRLNHNNRKTSLWGSEHSQGCPSLLEFLLKSTTDFTILLKVCIRVHESLQCTQQDPSVSHMCAEGQRFNVMQAVLHHHINGNLSKTWNKTEKNVFKM